jgi:hypothetical protein
MNERIRELAKEAGITMFGDAVYMHNCNDTLDVGVMEKFAELIIMECYEHCKGEMLDKEVADTYELTYNDGVMDCAVGLLQHFGVE